MNSNHVISPTKNRLRFVFDDAVISLNLPASATFQDIAQAWSDVTAQHYSHLVGIDVTLAGSSSARNVAQTALIIAS